MKESKIMWFENCSETVVSNRIKKMEKDGWEVKEHGITSERTNLGEVKVYISVLFQREKE